MTSNAWPPSSVRSGTLHLYTNKLTAFLHSRHSPSSNKAPNFLLWVGGLGDGLCTVGYPTYLAQVLPESWCLAEVMLSSSYNQFGTASLKQDAEELEKCVDYFKRSMSAGKIVIMGHSTGCQDIMEYLTGGQNARKSRVDGAIIQGSVSDREAFQAEMDEETYDKLIASCRQMKAEGKEQDVIPASFASTLFDGTPMTAYRWLSLLSPDKNGDDDLFSSDLTDEQLQASFGSLPEKLPFLILYGGADQFVPKKIDREALVGKWASVAKAAGVKVDEINGGVVPGMHHNLDEDSEEVVKHMCERVCKFLLKM